MSKLKRIINYRLKGVRLKGVSELVHRQVSENGDFPGGGNLNVDPGVSEGYDVRGPAEYWILISQGRNENGEVHAIRFDFPNDKEKSKFIALNLEMLEQFFKETI